MPPREIYLDHNATTPVAPPVLEAMLPWLSAEGYGNPSSAYRAGRAARAAVENARRQVAEMLGASPEEVIFTGCGTESIHAAIQSAAASDPDKTRIVTSAVEHSATLKLCEHMARRGYEIVRLGVDSSGALDMAQLEAAIDGETAVVSLLWANNETGVLFPIEEIAGICREKKVLFHVDAVQAAGKIPCAPLADLPGVSFFSLSGHKLYAPKGVGALYINRRVRFQPLLRGSQEGGRRGGTENVASVVGMGAAAEIAMREGAAYREEVRSMRDRFEELVLAGVEGASVNGGRDRRLPNTANIAFDGIESETALLLLDEAGVFCSAGSACTTGSVAPSHVLQAMGFSAARARSSLRFSFGKANGPGDAEEAAARVVRVVEKIRRENPAGPVVYRS